MSKVEAQFNHFYLPTVDEWCCNARYFFEGQLVDEKSWYHKDKKVGEAMGYVRWGMLTCIYEAPPLSSGEHVQLALPGMPEDGVEYPF